MEGTLLTVVLCGIATAGIAHENGQPPIPPPAKAGGLPEDSIDGILRESQKAI